MVQTIRVYPDPSLPEGSFIPGLGVDGADLPADEADALIGAGLATTTPPDEPATDPEGLSDG